MLIETTDRQRIKVWLSHGTELPHVNDIVTVKVTGTFRLVQESGANGVRAITLDCGWTSVEVDQGSCNEQFSTIPLWSDLEVTGCLIFTIKPESINRFHVSKTGHPLRDLRTLAASTVGGQPYCQGRCGLTARQPSAGHIHVQRRDAHHRAAYGQPRYSALRVRLDLPKFSFGRCAVHLCMICLFFA
jgi:hypothetical protein